MYSEYINELIAVIAISAVMVVSPGQDFAMITRNSLLYSRKAGILSAVGIFSAIWIHVGYSVAGIAIIISNSPLLYNTIKTAGAMYLLYLGIKNLFKKKIHQESKEVKNASDISDFSAFHNGFISNALNPKTTLFFLSIFTQVVGPSTPIDIQIVFGLIIALAHLIWFIAVAYFFSSKIFVLKFNERKLLMERLMGGALVLFALKIFFD